MASNNAGFAAGGFAEGLRSGGRTATEFQNADSVRRQVQLQENAQGYEMAKKDLLETQNALVQMAQQGRGAEAEMLLDKLVQTNVIPTVVARVNHFTGVNIPIEATVERLRQAIKSTQTPVQAAATAGQATRAKLAGQLGTTPTPYQSQVAAGVERKPFTTGPGAVTSVMDEQGKPQEIVAVPGKPEMSAGDKELDKIVTLSGALAKAEKALAKDPENRALSITHDALKQELVKSSVSADIILPLLKKKLDGVAWTPAETAAFDAAKSVGFIDQLMQGIAQGMGGGAAMPAAPQAGAQPNIVNPYAALSVQDLSQKASDAAFMKNLKATNPNGFVQFGEELKRRNLR